VPEHLEGPIDPRRGGEIVADNHRTVRVANAKRRDHGTDLPDRRQCAGGAVR